MTIQFGIVLCGALLMMTACSGGLESYKEEGEKTIQSLIEELQEVRTRQELVEAAPKLKKLFQELVDVMIAARHYRQTHSNAEPIGFSPKNRHLNECLRQELLRIYQIEGGREVIEKCQEEALIRLDAAEKKAFRNGGAVHRDVGRG